MMRSCLMVGLRSMVGSRPMRSTWNHMRKGEVNMKTLTPDQRAELVAAKRKELENYFAKSAWEFAAGGEQQQADRHGRVIAARWVLTWKCENETAEVPVPKAKARLVLRGYENPDVMSLSKASPTASRQARLWLLTAATWKCWIVVGAHVKAAFLSGSGFDRIILVKLPLDCGPLLGVFVQGIGRHAFVRLKKSAYGLSDAPLLGYQEACKRLEGLGWLSSDNQGQGSSDRYADPTCWRHLGETEVPRTLFSKLLWKICAMPSTLASTWSTVVARFLWMIMAWRFPISTKIAKGRREDQEITEQEKQGERLDWSFAMAHDKRNANASSFNVYSSWRTFWCKSLPAVGAQQGAPFWQGKLRCEHQVSCKEATAQCKFRWPGFGLLRWRCFPREEWQSLTRRIHPRCLRQFSPEGQQSARIDCWLAILQVAACLQIIFGSWVPSMLYGARGADDGQAFPGDPQESLQVTSWLPSPFCTRTNVPWWRTARASSMQRSEKQFSKQLTSELQLKDCWSRTCWRTCDANGTGFLLRDSWPMAWQRQELVKPWFKGGYIQLVADESYQAAKKKSREDRERTVQETRGSQSKVAQSLIALVLASNVRPVEGAVMLSRWWKMASYVVLFS